MESEIVSFVVDFSVAKSGFLNAVISAIKRKCYSSQKQAGTDSASRFYDLRKAAIDVLVARMS
jgi:hypothetical protein